MPRPKKIRLSVSVCRSVQRAPVQFQNCNNLESMTSAGDCLHGREYGFLNHDRAMLKISVSLYFYISGVIWKTTEILHYLRLISIV